MNRRCLDAAELGELERLDLADPRRAHLETCPRCRARLAAYRRFMEEPAPLPEGSDPESARAKLRAALRAEMALAPWGRRAWWRVPASLAPRLGLAAAGVLLVAGVWLGVERWRSSGRGELVLRSDGRAPAAAEVEVEPARVSQGRVELRWRRHPGADAYQVVLLDTALEPRGTQGPMRDTSVVISPPELGGPRPPGVLFYWEVQALRSGEVIARSRPQTLRVP